MLSPVQRIYYQAKRIEVLTSCSQAVCSVFICPQVALSHYPAVSRRLDWVIMWVVSKYLTVEKILTYYGLQTYMCCALGTWDNFPQRLKNKSVTQYYRNILLLGIETSDAEVIPAENIAGDTTIYHGVFVNNCKRGRFWPTLPVCSFSENWKTR